MSNSEVKIQNVRVQDMDNDREYDLVIAIYKNGITVHLADEPTKTAGAFIEVNYGIFQVVIYNEDSVLHEEPSQIVEIGDVEELIRLGKQVDATPDIP